MKIFLKIIICILIPLHGFTQVGKDPAKEMLERDDDLKGSFFSLENLKNLDVGLAIELAEKQVKTIAKSLINKTVAAVPYTGNAGVAMEVGVSNLKLDELIVTNKNYNYQITSILGNILKVTKEARDGTIFTRAKNKVKKIELVNESLKLIKKCQRTKRTLDALSEKGWTTNNMLRAVNSIDITLKSLETVGTILLETANSLFEENKKLDELEIELKDLDKMMDEMYASSLKELNETVRTKYHFEYNSSLLNGAMYFQDMTKKEGQEKYELGMEKSKDGLTAFRNTMWLISILFFFIGAAAIIWKVFFMGEESQALIKYTKAWFIGFAITILLASMLQYALPIIYS